MPISCLRSNYAELPECDCAGQQEIIWGQQEFQSQVAQSATWEWPPFHWCMAGQLTYSWGQYKFSGQVAQKIFGPSLPTLDQSIHPCQGLTLRHSHMPRACRFCLRACKLLWLHAQLGKWFSVWAPDYFPKSIHKLHGACTNIGKAQEFFCRWLIHF